MTDQERITALEAALKDCAMGLKFVTDVISLQNFELMTSRDVKVKLLKWLRDAEDLLGERI